jgi:transcriptional regulator with XRE-family HTH domain
MQQLGFNIEAFRKLMRDNHLTQAGLARKMGLTRACINRYMNGIRKKPSPKVIDGFSRAFPNHSITYYFFTPSVTHECHQEEGFNGTHHI